MSVGFVSEEPSLEVELKVGYNFLEESSGRPARLVGFVPVTTPPGLAGCGGNFGGGGLAGGVLLTLVDGCVPRSTSCLPCSVLPTGLYLMGFVAPPNAIRNRCF